ncbi:UNVERIFIED_CONTAM: Pentatricopeptide repeat-containing protein [Sesamum calycinum]|uniref:Pentatricopeptide repeat-containing protein n=1 Tax=Sesamum calycinum TaxID=2727403 RepID=A0AAW2SEC8_9LAMI
MEEVGLNHDGISYTGVLSACANISAIKEGKQIHAFAIRRLFHEQLFIANSLLDLYTKCGRIDTAREGRWDEADRIRKLMNLRSVKKNPGCSWVQTQDEIHGFIAGERPDNAFGELVLDYEAATISKRNCYYRKQRCKSRTEEHKE